MSFPRLEIHLSRIRENARKLYRDCKAHGVEPVGITKVCCGQPEVARVLFEEGYKTLGDSRLENLARYASLPCRKMLIRLPMPSQAEDVVRIADVSLNSEIATAEALSRAAARLGRDHGIVAMLELGDLREGCPTPEDFKALCRRVHELPGLTLEGVGANFVCYGGAKPSTEALNELLRVKAEVEDELGIQIPVVSGGSSTTERLMMAGGLPEGVNQLRAGALIQTGIGLMDEKIDGYHDDAYILKAEVIERNTKPSMPYGELGTDAFGRQHQWQDRGPIERCIVAVGREDVELECLEPLDPGVTILGGSSDHVLLELRDSARAYRVGDAVSFKVGYVGVLRACTSNYVKKICVE